MFYVIRYTLYVICYVILFCGFISYHFRIFQFYFVNSNSGIACSSQLHRMHITNHIFIISTFRVAYFCVLRCTTCSSTTGWACSRRNRFWCWEQKTTTTTRNAVWIGCSASWASPSSLRIVYTPYPDSIASIPGRTTPTDPRSRCFPKLSEFSTISFNRTTKCWLNYYTIKSLNGTTYGQKDNWWLYWSEWDYDVFICLFVY